MKKGGVPSANNIVITEIFHDQPQLFGFPLISNPFTDPVPLYTNTVMRIISAARSSGGVEGSITSGIDTIGPICLVYPMLVKDSDIGPSEKDIIQYGWLKWNSASPLANEQYLSYSLLYPQMSLNDFPQEGGVQINSDVTKVSLTNPNFDNQLEALRGQRIIIPVTTDTSSGTIKVSRFVWATITDYNVDSSPNYVKANFDTTTALPAACN